MADTWHVVSQRQTTQLSAGGTFQDVMEVTFLTASGTTGSVVIPLTNFGPAAVQSAIAARVEAIDAVHAL